MREYLLKEQIAIIALDAQDSLHRTVVKDVGILAIEAVEVLQELLGADLQEDLQEVEAYLKEQLHRIKKMGKKERNAVEEEIANILKAEEILTEIPDLMGCDILYYTAEITMRQYKMNEDVYLDVARHIRGSLLEQDDISEEGFCMAWLLRESGCMHEIFSIEEQEEIENKLKELRAENSLYKLIWEEEVHRSGNTFYKKYLNWKEELFRNPYLEGVNLLFPFLDRRQSVFIDMVVFGTTVQDRRQAAMEFLRSYGHTCEEMQIGTETLVKIDNKFYRVFPNVKNYELPIQGVSLVPVYR